MCVPRPPRNEPRACPASAHASAEADRAGRGLAKRPQTPKRALPRRTKTVAESFVASQAFPVSHFLNWAPQHDKLASDNANTHMTTVTVRLLNSFSTAYLLTAS